MAYCRWSSDNFNCDLYCYEDCNGGWTTHVAGNRIDGTLPDEPSMKLLSEDPGEFEKQYHKHTEAVMSAKRVAIGGPHDGETFNDETLEGFLERLLDLKAKGYRFSDEVIDQVKYELGGGGYDQPV